MTTAGQGAVRASPPARGDRATTVSWPFWETLERLLEDRPLADISVDDLAKGVGISRSTFYFYFPSKDAVLLTLLDRIIKEADERADVALGPMDTAVDPAGVWRAINALFESFGAHRAVTLAGAAGASDERRDAVDVDAVHAEVDRLHRRVDPGGA